MKKIILLVMFVGMFMIGSSRIFAVELLTNGGFETGALAPWVAQYGGCTDNGTAYFPLRVIASSNGTGVPGVPTVTPRTGGFFANSPWTCGPQLATGVYYPAGTGFVTMYQDVTVPASNIVILNFSERLYTNLNFYVSPDWRCAHSQDYRVQIRNTSNAVLQTVYSRTAPAFTTTNDAAYNTHAFNLGNAYAGQTIRLAFVFTIDTGLSAPGNSGIDDVSMDARPPLAASVSVSGRVMSQEGRGITNALVRLTDENGTRTVLTGRFGSYQFANVQAGTSVVLSVVSRRYVFQNPTRVLTLSDDLSNEDFTVSP